MYYRTINLSQTRSCFEGQVLYKKKVSFKIYFRINNKLSLLRQSNSIFRTYLAFETQQEIKGQKTQIIWWHSCWNRSEIKSPSSFDISSQTWIYFQNNCASYWLLSESFWALVDTPVLKWLHLIYYMYNLGTVFKIIFTAVRIDQGIALHSALRCIR